MSRVSFVIDDASIGGVTRSADHLCGRLGGDVAAHVLAMPAAWRLAPSIDADIVVVDLTMSWAKLPWLASLRARLGRRKLVITEHTYTAAYEERLVQAPRRFRHMLRTAYRLADRIVAVSHGQAQWLQAAGLVGGDKLSVIPQALDVRLVSALPLADRVPGAPLRLAAFGRYCEQKGFDTLIDAMRLVPPSVAQLELAGYGPLDGALRAAAAGLPHVTVGGPIDGPADLLARSDVVVIPSRWEAFGLVALEARAAGRPVIAAAVDGLVEQVAPNWGSLVAPGSPGALASAIHDLASRDLAPMAAAARASTAGVEERKVAAWQALLRGFGAGTAACGSTRMRIARA